MSEVSPYRERILDHYRNPRHRGRLPSPHWAGEADNPVCGDWVRIELRVDREGRVVEAAFEGEGCVIALASASMLTDYILNRDLLYLRAMRDEDMLAFLEVDLGWARSQCALVALEALRDAVGGVK